MFRFISFLFGKQWEPCQSCENLKLQIEYLRDDNRKLTDTLVSIVKPKEVEAPPVEINQIQASSALFSRRRAALEEKDRQEAQILAMKKHVAMPDIAQIRTVNELEKELGIEEENHGS